jgi:SAM-dependent methyltransferase
MLHHMPSSGDQDRLFAAVARVLRPGGLFVGVDSVDSEPIRQGHADDTFIPVDPETMGQRLATVGLVDCVIETADYQFRFSARRPA